MRPVEVGPAEPLCRADGHGNRIHGILDLKALQAFRESYFAVHCSHLITSKKSYACCNYPLPDDIAQLDMNLLMHSLSLVRLQYCHLVRNY